MGCTNLQCWPVIWYGVCCFGLASRGDTYFSLGSFVLEFRNDRIDLNTMSLLDSLQPPTKLLLGLQVRLHLRLISWVEALGGRLTLCCTHDCSSFDVPSDVQNWKRCSANNRESASSLMGSLERGLAPLSQCECLCQNLHHCASADVFITSLDTTWLAQWCRENVGLLGSTRIGSRRVIQISAGFMIFFSMLGEPLFDHHVVIGLFADHVCNWGPECEEQLLTPFIYRIAGKFGALFASIPFTIFAAVYCVLFGLVGWSSCFPEPIWIWCE